LPSDLPFYDMEFVLQSMRIYEKLLHVNNYYLRCDPLFFLCLAIIDMGLDTKH